MPETGNKALPGHPIAFLLGAGFANNFLDVKNNRPLPLVSGVEKIFGDAWDDFHMRCVNHGRDTSISVGSKGFEMPPSKCPISGNLIRMLKKLYAQLSGADALKVNIEQCIGLLYDFEDFRIRAGCDFRNYPEFAKNRIWGPLLRVLGPHLGSNLNRDLIDIPLSECFPRPMSTNGSTFQNLEICDLFESVFEKQKFVNIFSLNWDLSVESYYKYRAQKPLSTGFEDVGSTIRKRLPPTVRVGEFKAWNPGGFETSTRNLFKLHGSLNWKSIRPYRVEKLFRRVPDYSGPNDYPPLLEDASAGPLNWLDGQDAGHFKNGQRVFHEKTELLVGTNKEARYFGEPFSTLIGFFKGELRKAACLYVIGYGFGDKGVNDLLVSSVQQRAQSNNPLRLIIVSKDQDDARAIIEREEPLAQLAQRKTPLVETFAGTVHDLKAEFEREKMRVKCA